MNHCGQWLATGLAGGALWLAGSGMAAAQSAALPTSATTSAKAALLGARAEQIASLNTIFIAMPEADAPTLKGFVRIEHRAATAHQPCAACRAA